MSDEPLGPPPSLTRLVVVTYALSGVALLGFGIVAAARGEGWQPVRDGLPIALYTGALACTASRIRSKTAKRPASAWILAPVLLHALVGLAGTATLIAVGSHPRAHSLGDLALTASLVAVLLGWAPALAPLYYARRAGWFLLATFSWLIFLVVFAGVGGPRWF